MEYSVQIYNNYESIVLTNSTEELELDLNDFVNFKTNPFLNNDTITYNNVTKTIENVVNNNKGKRFVGILQVSNKMVYGLNSRKNPYYLCKPLDKHLPSFLIAVNDKKIINACSTNYYVVFKYDRWNKNKTYPYGELIKMLGKINDKHTEYDALLNHYNIDQRKKKVPKGFSINNKSQIYNFTTKEELVNYVDYTNEYTVAIDPKGCLDIDDAISFKKLENGYEVGVHIADVSFWVKKMKLEKYLEHQYFTVYCPHKKFNIFPNILSDHLMSLKYNQDRMAMSLIMTIDNDLNVTDYKLQQSIVNVNKTMTYGKANNLIKTNDELKMMFNISKKLFNKDCDNYDSHNMIENYMLYANNKVGQYLKDNGVKTVYRIHKDKKYDIDTDNLDINNNVKDFLRYFQMESAEYTFDNDTYYHSGLQMKYYTHFTSPIRRIVDIYIHNEIKNILNGTDYNIQLDCDKINSQSKQLKKLGRQMDVIDLKHKQKIDNSKVYKCYIVDFDENKVNIYIPELKYHHSQKLYNRMVMNMLDFNITSTEMTIENKQNDLTPIKMVKYEEYKIKLLYEDNSLKFSFETIDILNIL